MRLLHSHLTKLLVHTQSGTELGRVHDVVYDVESHTVAKYVVTSGLIRHKVFEVSPRQIISITESEMIVEDTLTPVNVNQTEFDLPNESAQVLVAESES